MYLCFLCRSLHRPDKNAHARTHADTSSCQWCVSLSRSPAGHPAASALRSRGGCACRPAGERSGADGQRGGRRGRAPDAHRAPHHWSAASLESHPFTFLALSDQWLSRGSCSGAVTLPAADGAGLAPAPGVAPGARGHGQVRQQWSRAQRPSAPSGRRPRPRGVATTRQRWRC